MEGNWNGAQGNNKYQYNQKEWNDDFGLGWNHHDWRFFDVAINRFVTIDPESETGEQRSWNPYHFSFDNPIRYSDPDGRQAEDIILRGANNSSVTVQTDLIIASADISSLGVDFGGQYTLSGDNIVQASVDIIGIFDPTPAFDLLGASMSAKSGDYWGAGASLLGAVVPVVGDLAKVGKISKGIDGILDALKAQGKPLAVTASGRAFDIAKKQPIGSSRKPIVHTVKHATQKKAEDAARRGGKGTPVKHTKDKQGGRHYHHGFGKKGKGKGTKGYGTRSGKVDDNVHHEYPK